MKIDGLDIFEDAAQAKRLLGYLPEQPPLYLDRTPREYLSFVGRAKGLDKAELAQQMERVMSVTQIEDVSDRLIKNLSKGYRQRVGIAQALLGEPKVVILDEPTVGLDPIQIIEIRDLIKDLGREHTVILSSHMLGELEELTSSKTIEAPDDLAEYGLDEPECSISVTAEAETTIDIGGETSLDGLRYVSIGDGNVYLVSSDLLTNFSCGLYDLVSKEAIPDMSDLVSFTVETASGTLDIEYLEDSGLAYTDRYTWFSLADGEYTALDNELTEDLVSLVTGLSWGECVDYDADVKDLGDYGLDTPSVTVSVSYIETTEVETNETDEDGEPVYETREEEKTFNLELGSYSADGGCYARIAGSEMIYLIDAGVCDSLLYADTASLLPEDVILLDWDKTTGFDIELGGETYSVDMELAEETDEEGSTLYDYAFSLDGEEADFTDVLQQLEALSSTGSAEGVSTALGEEIAFTFHRNSENFAEVELVIYGYDSASCIAVLNGGSALFVPREDVQAIVDAVKALLA